MLIRCIDTARFGINSPVLVSQCIRQKAEITPLRSHMFIIQIVVVQRRLYSIHVFYLRDTLTAKI
ncbi:hypothetical protein AA102526_2818 [Asaia lannensis NBRC 102526]|nr:hypothetical protein AA102526_2818 [Asaia lannensis NBRC 102526]